MMSEEEELSPTEFAEGEQLIVTTLREYTEVWQSGETPGEMTIRLGALAFERILGWEKAPPNYKAWNLLVMETNNAFKNSRGVGKRFEIVA